MTKRERTLGLVLIGTIIAAGTLFGVELYLERLQELDRMLSKTRLEIAQFQLSQKNWTDKRVPKRQWTKAEASDDVFLREFSAQAASAGWTMQSANLLEKKGNRSVFSIRFSGPDIGWGAMLHAVATWRRTATLRTVEAFPEKAGSMACVFEVMYESP